MKRNSYYVLWLLNLLDYKQFIINFPTQFVRSKEYLSNEEGTLFFNFFLQNEFISVITLLLSEHFSSSTTPNMQYLQSLSDLSIYCLFILVPFYL